MPNRILQPPTTRPDRAWVHSAATATVFATGILNRHSGVGLAQEPDDLLLDKPLFHVQSSSGWGIGL